MCTYAAIHNYDNMKNDIGEILLFYIKTKSEILLKIKTLLFHSILITICITVLLLYDWNISPVHYFFYYYYCFTTNINAKYCIRSHHSHREGPFGLHTLTGFLLHYTATGYQRVTHHSAIHSQSTSSQRPRTRRGVNNTDRNKASSNHRDERRACDRQINPAPRRG